MATDARHHAKRTVRAGQWTEVEAERGAEYVDGRLYNHNRRGIYRMQGKKRCDGATVVGRTRRLGVRHGRPLGSVRREISPFLVYIKLFKIPGLTEAGIFTSVKHEQKIENYETVLHLPKVRGSFLDFTLYLSLLRVRNKEHFNCVKSSPSWFSTVRSPRQRPLCNHNPHAVTNVAPTPLGGHPSASRLRPHHSAPFAVSPV